MNVSILLTVELVNIVLLSILCSVIYVGRQSTYENLLSFTEDSV